MNLWSALKMPTVTSPLSSLKMILPIFTAAMLVATLLISNPAFAVNPRHIREAANRINNPPPFSEIDANRRDWQRNAPTEKPADKIKASFDDFSYVSIWKFDPNQDKIYKYVDGDFDGSMPKDSYDLITDPKIIQNNHELKGIAKILQIEPREVLSVAVITWFQDKNQRPYRIMKFTTKLGDRTAYFARGTVDNVTTLEDYNKIDANRRTCETALKTTVDKHFGNLLKKN